jgi:hypothetical protein
VTETQGASAPILLSVLAMLLVLVFAYNAMAADRLRAAPERFEPSPTSTPLPPVPSPLAPDEANPALAA